MTKQRHIQIIRTQRPSQSLIHWVSQVCREVRSSKALSTVKQSNKENLRRRIMWVVHQFLIRTVKETTTNRHRWAIRVQIHHTQAVRFTVNVERQFRWATGNDLLAVRAVHRVEDLVAIHRDGTTGEDEGEWDMTGAGVGTERTVRHRGQATVQIRRIRGIITRESMEKGQGLMINEGTGIGRIKGIGMMRIGGMKRTGSMRYTLPIREQSAPHTLIGLESRQ